MNILITQVSKIGSMGWIKALKRIKSIDINLYGIDIYPLGYSAGSLLVNYYTEISDKLNVQQYIDFLLSYCEQNNIKLILPVMDNELKLLIKSNNFSNIMCTPTFDVFSIFNDKLTASNAMHDIGILIPEIIQNPFGRKKVIIRDKIGIGSRGIYIVDLENETYIENRFQNNRFMQEYVEGEEYTVDVMTDKHGTPILILPRKRLEIRQGVSFKCQLLNDTDIIENCKKIYSNYKIPGISNVQFIKNDTGTYFIELNPRLGGTSIASIIGGFNFVELFIKHYLLGESLKEPSYYHNLIAWESIITRDYNEYIYLP